MKNKLFSTLSYIGRRAGEEAGALLLHKHRLHRGKQLGQPGVYDGPAV